MRCVIQCRGFNNGERASGRQAGSAGDVEGDGCVLEVRRRRLNQRAGGEGRGNRKGDRRVLGVKSANRGIARVRYRQRPRAFDVQVCYADVAAGVVQGQLLAVGEIEIADSHLCCIGIGQIEGCVVGCGVQGRGGKSQIAVVFRQIDGRRGQGIGDEGCRSTGADCTRACGLSTFAACHLECIANVNRAGDAQRCRAAIAALGGIISAAFPSRPRKDFQLVGYSKLAIGNTDAASVTAAAAGIQATIASVAALNCDVTI